jgi:hypothetical protein
VLLVGAVQLQRATASDCGAGIAREAEKVEEEGQWSKADTVRCAVAARGVVARHSSRAAAVDRYWIHLQLGTSNGSRKGSIRRLLLVLASAIRVDGCAANGRQQKRMQWLRDNKFILDVILDTPDALSHVIGHPPPPPYPPQHHT